MSILHHSAITSLKPARVVKPKTPTRPNSVRSESTTAENSRVTLSQKNDSVEICRVLNGMWQTSGGWGRIDRHDAVEAMLRYSDAGLTTFDMADHYKSHKTRRGTGNRTATLWPVSCAVTKGERLAVVRNGKDSLEMSRVVNGMWQTRGGWGEIDRDNAVGAMIKLADGELATFDMADIC